jgi:tetratricopeptide (TPR) repeat protein
VRQVGQELGVRYVLEGSVRKAGGRIRIAGQLINAADGSHLWADRFEGLLEDIFELQDQVTSKVVGSIAPRLLEAEVERASRRRPDNLDVYDLYLRALPAVRAITLEGNNTALALVERALKLDPDYAVAAGLGAWAYTLRAAQNWRIDPEGERQRAIELARIALAKGQDDADALAMGGYTIGFLGHQLRDAVAATDRAITLNPNNALAHANAGWLHAYLGAADHAIDHLQCSIRLSPRDPTLFRVYAALAFAHLLRNEFDIAAEWGRRAFDANPNFAPTHRVLAAALAHAGRVDEARQVAEHLLSVSPQDSVSRFAGYSVFRYSGRLDLILDGLRMAGVPE